MVALAALWLLAASRVHVNASWSDEAWGYAAFPLFGGAPKVGDRVLFDPRPDPASQAGTGRGEPAPVQEPGSQAPATGSKIPYLKTVRGLPGMTVEVGADGTVTVGGVHLGRAKTRALDGRPLEAIPPGTIPADHYFLHADHVDSHDSRYAEIGLVPRTRIFGRAVALPDLPWLGLEGPLVGPEDGPETVPVGRRP